jgi:hypothetical protein
VGEIERLALTLLIIAIIQIRLPVVTDDARFRTSEVSIMDGIGEGDLGRTDALQRGVVTYVTIRRY